VKERILQTLHDLRSYALAQQIDAAFFLHEEESCLMRCANSAISLNTSEHLLRLEIIAYAGRKRASLEMITALGNVAEMQQGVDRVAEMVQHAQPLDYQPTVPAFAETLIDESGFDAGLAKITNADRLEFFNQAAAGLETDEIRLSGIFSSGVTTLAQISTCSEHCQYFKTTDAQISIVLSHATLKWELRAEQSARQATDLDPSALHHDLAFLLEQYQQDAPCQLALGRYDVVFGSAAIAELLDIMNFIGFDGGSMKRGYSFITEDQVSQKVLSDHFTLIDDPTCPDTFPFQRDFMGISRKPFPLFTNGTFRSFTWSQDDADEFGTAPTGHTVMHKSLVLAGGNTQVSTLKELVDLPHSNDLLYIPALHYLNIVNPSTGLITASSRFGALLLTKDGSVVVPYNVRITQSLRDIFGDKLAWLSQTRVVHNTSNSYGARNPTAIVVPAFLQVNDLEISHTNASY